MKLFMENVVLLFGMVEILVIDADSHFKSVFKNMWESLGIIFWTLACGNNKGMSVENFTTFSTKRRQ